MFSTSFWKITQKITSRNSTNIHHKTLINFPHYSLILITCQAFPFFSKSKHKRKEILYIWVIIKGGSWRNYHTPGTRRSQTGRETRTHWKITGGKERSGIGGGKKGELIFWHFSNAKTNRGKKGKKTNFSYTGRSQSSPASKHTWQNILKLYSL